MDTWSGTNWYTSTNLLSGTGLDKHDPLRTTCDNKEQHWTKKAIDTVDCIYLWTHALKTCFQMAPNVCVSGVKLWSLADRNGNFRAKSSTHSECVELTLNRNDSGLEISRGNKCQLMTTSLLREVTEPAVFVPKVIRAITRDCFRSTPGALVLDKIIWRFFEGFNEDLPKLPLIRPTEMAERLDIETSFEKLMLFCVDMHTQVHLNHF